MLNFKENNIDKMLFKLPMCCYGWCEYKGEVFFAMINREATIKAKRPMIDLSYCATKAMNQIIIKTVAYDKNKFKKAKHFN